MIPREIFRIDKSPYVMDAVVYRRFDARKTGFVLVGLQDTGKVAPNHWLNKMQRKMMGVSHTILRTRKIMVEMTRCR